MKKLLCFIFGHSSDSSLKVSAKILKDTYYTIEEHHCKKCKKRYIIVHKDIIDLSLDQEEIDSINNEISSNEDCLPFLINTFNEEF